MIAELLRTGKSLEPRLPQGVYADLKHTYRSYRRVRTERTRHGNLLIGMMDLLFPEYHGVFKDLTGKSSVAALRFCPVPSRIQMMSLDEWMLGVRHCFEGQRLMVAKLREIYKLAQDSIGIPEEEESLVSDVEYLLALLAVLNNRITILERKLLELLRNINGYEHLLSIPGIGSLTAAGILAEVGNIQDFHKSKEVVKFSGVQPTEEQSSQHRGKSSMTKKGSPGLRNALYLAALNLVRCNPVFKDHYDHLVHRDKRPLSKMKALGAMMNKLLRIVYALMSKGEDFDSQKASPQQDKEVALVAV
jgi:putative component of membrane protein insertase Oxa1/YidC/SpoIIIJ protein YidD